MRKTIFISCGQYTAAEKHLGKQIAEMVRRLTDLELCDCAVGCRGENFRGGRPRYGTPEHVAPRLLNLVVRE